MTPPWRALPAFASLLVLTSLTVIFAAPKSADPPIPVPSPSPLLHGPALEARDQHSFTLPVASRMPLHGVAPPSPHGTPAFMAPPSPQDDPDWVPSPHGAPEWVPSPHGTPDWVPSPHGTPAPKPSYNSTSSHHSQTESQHHHHHKHKKASNGTLYLPGKDFSFWDNDIDMREQHAAGSHFAFIRATEGDGTRDPKFDERWKEAVAANLYVSPYHYALPDRSNGAQQARFFLDNGGRSLATGRTLPAMLDIEYNNETSQDACYGMQGEPMVNWIRDWVRTYHNETGIWPIIYTENAWWIMCTNDCRHFSHHTKLFVAKYSDIGAREGFAALNEDELGPLFGGWKEWTFWQYAIEVPGGGDNDVFNGNLTDLHELALEGEASQRRDKQQRKHD